ncbi:hypothetical protein Tco_0743859 [Tanacetum coccineum]
MTLAASTSTDKILKDFDKLMSTPIDFSGYILNDLKIENLTQEVLFGPAFRLLKGTRSSGDYPFDLSKPLPLIMCGNRQRVPFELFINNDLKYLQGGISTMTYTTSTTKTKVAQYDLLGIEDMVRIKQKSQENGQNRTNTNTGTEEHTKSQKFSIKVDRFNDLLRACPHHGFSELHQLDTFYNALNANDQDSLNSAAGGNFLDKMPRECLRIIESKSKVRNSRNKAVVAKVSSNSSTPGISPDVAALTTEVSELKNMMKTMLIRQQKPKLPHTGKAVEA